MLADLVAPGASSAPLPAEQAPDQAAAAESNRISQWLTENWDKVPEVSF
jgi:hypothetical protein